MTGAKAGRLRLKYDLITCENKEHLLEDKIICHVILVCTSTKILTQAYLMKTKGNSELNIYTVQVLTFVMV